MYALSGLWNPVILQRETWSLLSCSMTSQAMTIYITRVCSWHVNDAKFFIHDNEVFPGF